MQNVDDLICSDDAEDIFGILCALINLFPDIAILLGASTSGTRRLEDAEILSRLEPVFGHVEGGRNLQASNMELIAQFLANAKNIPAPRLPLNCDG